MQAPGNAPSFVRGDAQSANMAESGRRGSGKRARTKAGTTDASPAPVVVEILGPAGVGKTAISEAVRALLRENSPELISDNSASWIQSIHRWIRFPLFIPVAWRLSRMTPKFNFGFWLHRLTVLDEWYERGRSIPSVVVSDMGLLHFLKKVRGTLSYALLAKLPLPDAAVILHAPFCDIAWRQALRSKPNRVLERRGRRQERRAVRIARYLLHERGEEETLRFFEVWNNQHSPPRLSAATLHHCLEIARAVPPPPRISGCDHEMSKLKPDLLAVGVHWFEVNNAVSRDRADVAREIVNIILHQLPELRRGRALRRRAEVAAAGGSSEQAPTSARRPLG